MKKVTIEVVDTTKEFKFRMVYENEFSEYGSYTTLLTHIFNGELWGCCSQYYDGVLPIMIPFKIIVP